MLAGLGSYTTVLECVATGTSTVAGSADGSFTMPDEPVTCTYTNTRAQHEVTLQKAWVDARSGDTAGLKVVASQTTGATSTATGALGTVVDSAHQATAPALVGDEVTVSEVLGTANLGVYGSSLTCTSGGTAITVDKAGTFTMPDAAVVCTFTNARTVVAPPPPVVTAASCDPGVPGTQILGSITIAPNADYAVSIDGVPVAAGTYQWAAGTYSVTAQLVSGPIVRSGMLSQLAVQPTYTWTIVVPASATCPLLDKSSDPPSGTTVQAGEVVTYPITVRNGGGTAVTNETVTDQLPDGATLIESTVAPTGTYDTVARTITWRFDLAAAAGGVPASATFTYQVEVTADEGTLVNTARWVERDLTASTKHPVEPGETPTTEVPPEELPSTGASSEMGPGAAGLLFVLLVRWR